MNSDSSEDPTAYLDNILLLWCDQTFHFSCVETSFFARFQAFGRDLVRGEWRAVWSCYEKKHTSSWIGATVPDSRAAADTTRLMAYGETSSPPVQLVTNIAAQKNLTSRSPMGRLLSFVGINGHKFSGFRSF
jgi:hypothetical protein